MFRRRNNLKLNEKGKIALTLIISAIVLVIFTVNYSNRIEKIKNGTFEIVSDREMDK